jgi:putative tryptophan/tyrosine transport system substrate-binding protein
MGADMQRREFITLLGGAAAAWPLTARAQQPAMPVIGYLHGQSPERLPHLMHAFRQGLNETGYVEGRNVAIEFHSAEGQTSRLPALAAEIVNRQVTVIAATGGLSSVLAAKAATTTIPIVFLSGDDPVKLGIVASFNRPGGNATGIHVFLQAMEGKRLGLLRELVPTAAMMAALVNPTNAAFQLQMKDIEDAARALGVQMHTLNAINEQDIHAAFAALGKLRPGALLVGSDPFFNSRREQLATLAAHYAIPAIYEAREYAVAGGLMSYGTSLIEGYRQVGVYTGRILKGEKPADLPVVQSTKFEFVLNLKAAKTLGLEVPPALSARADEVIE